MLTQTIWLASYPKSGNTWLRLFLNNLLFPEKAPVQLNHMPLPIPAAASRTLFDREIGICSSLLSNAETEQLRPFIQEQATAQYRKQHYYIKTHDAYTYLKSGEALMGSTPEFSAIYLIRDPRDVAISAANHWLCTPEEAANRMLKKTLILSNKPNGITNQLPQRQLTWQQHAISWLTAPIPVHLMCYEEMINSPLEAFGSTVRFLNLPYDDEQILAALDACNFKRLQKMEKQQRFMETLSEESVFFRSGRTGEGKEKLPLDRKSVV